MADRAAVLAVCLLAGASFAHAHGRPPRIGDLRFHPTNADMMVARATWGLVISRDAGASWRWICADVMGVDPTREDPAVLVMPDGALLVGTLDGLVRSTPDHCAFATRPEGLGDAWAIDLDAVSTAPATVYAAVTSGVGPDRLYRSDDAGRSFTPLGDPIDDVLLERVRVAPSDPQVIYLSGFIPRRPIADAGAGLDGGTAFAPREAYVLRSDDGGASLARTFVPLEDGERNLHVYAVDPTDPDRLLLRVTRRVTDDRPERLLLSEDGARTFVTALSARELSDAAFSADGARAWATSRTTDGLFVSDDAGRGFTQIALGNFTCVETHGDAVYVCVDELRDGYALGRSDDGGATIAPILRFAEIHTLPDCPTCSEVAYVCAAWFPDLVYDLGLDAAAPDRGTTGAPRDSAPPAACIDGAVVMRDGGIGMDGGAVGGSAGCGCSAAGAPWGGSAFWWFLVVAAGARARRRSGAGGSGR